MGITIAYNPMYLPNIIEFLDFYCKCGQCKRTVEGDNNISDFLLKNARKSNKSYISGAPEIYLWVFEV